MSKIVQIKNRRRYRLVAEFHARNFESAVQNAIDDGYELFGPPLVFGEQLVQPLTLNRNEEVVE